MTGLEGVVAAQTRLSEIDGDAGRLTLAGYRVEDLAPRVSFEAVAFLLWHDRLPTAEENQNLRKELGELASIPPATVDALRDAATRNARPIDAMRLGMASIALEEPSRERVLAVLPTIVAAFARLRNGAEPLAYRTDLGFVANYLFMLTAEPPSEGATRALTTYLNTVADHGLNASTFAARVIASTQSDLGAAIEGALAALKGPLHGGAPGPALEAFLELRAGTGDLATKTRAWVAGKLEASERIMGFGHRVYRVRDPRADVLADAAKALLHGTGLYEDARRHEQAVLETLAEHKPGRRIATNVEFYTALLLHGLRIPVDLFTPTFAIGRTAGWIGHVEEQRRSGRLIRPRAEYVGVRDRSPL